MPVDNLAVDRNGDIWAAGMPKALDVIASLDDPFGKTAPSTVFKITKTDTGYTSVKIIEDKEMKVLTGVTVARHDVQSRRMFFGGKLVSD